MALRNWLSQRIFNWHAQACQIDAQVTIGATGACTLVTSSSNGSIPTSRGVKSITRMSQGRYRLQLDDNYSQLLSFATKFSSVVSGAAVLVIASGAALSIGTMYQITLLGTTTQANWVTLGLPAGLTAAVGMTFKAAATGAGTGSGAVKVMTANAVSGSELLASQAGVDAMLNNQPFTQGSGGGYIDFECLAATGTGTATFTGAALATHTHSIPAGTDSAGGTSGATSGGTPAGTIAFTGTAPVATDPSDTSTMYIKILVSNSKVG